MNESISPKQPSIAAFPPCFTQKLVKIRIKSAFVNSCYTAYKVSLCLPRMAMHERFTGTRQERIKSYAHFFKIQMGNTHIRIVHEIFHAQLEWRKGGRITVNFVPFCTWLSTCMLPSWWVTMEFAMCSPRPVPSPIGLVV